MKPLFRQNFISWTDSWEARGNKAIFEFGVIGCFPLVSLDHTYHSLGSWIRKCKVDRHIDHEGQPDESRSTRQQSHCSISRYKATCLEVISAADQATQSVISGRSRCQLGRFPGPTSPRHCYDMICCHSQVCMWTSTEWSSYYRKYHISARVM